MNSFYLGIFWTGGAEEGFDVEFYFFGDFVDGIFVGVKDFVSSDSRVADSSVGLGNGCIFFIKVGDFGIERCDLKLRFIGCVGRF